MKKIGIVKKRKNEPPAPLSLVEALYKKAPIDIGASIREKYITMDLAKFKKLSKVYSKFPLAKEIVNSIEYKEYMNAFHQNKECYEWTLKRQIKEAGINYKKHCCIQMAYYLIEDIKDQKQQRPNYDSIITYRPKRKEYGLPIHDGGNSYILITYCPWCGSRLKKNK